MLFDILKYDLFCNGTAGGAKVASGPEMPPPIPFADLWELLLDLVRRATLRTLHKTANGNTRRDRHEQVDVIVGQHALDDRDVHLTTNLANNIADTLPQCITQNFESVFGNPNNMVAVVENCVRGFIIGVNRQRVTIHDRRRKLTPISGAYAAALRSAAPSPEMEIQSSMGVEIARRLRVSVGCRLTLWLEKASRDGCGGRI